MFFLTTKLLRAINCKAGRSIRRHRQHGPAADKGPAAGREPAADKGPAADEGPASDQGPAADKGPASYYGPATDKGPAAGQGPAADKVLAVVQGPAVDQGPKQAITSLSSLINNVFVYLYIVLTNILSLPSFYFTLHVLRTGIALCLTFVYDPLDLDAEAVYRQFFKQLNFKKQKIREIFG